MAKNSTNTKSFWYLISDYIIKIPQIQRDYAQGRNSASTIRHGLVSGMHKALCGTEKMVLNFIYGSIENEDNHDLFIPVDGQQRLTTLFLLHWYVLCRAIAEDDSYKSDMQILKSFMYSSRNTSERFCNSLCDSCIDFDNENLSEQVENLSWYTGAISSDPTVQSMLVVIDELHEAFIKEKNFSDLWLTLKDQNPPISFIWLKLDKFKQPEDMYIKMNARGKELTEFELLKAKFQDKGIFVKITDGKEPDIDLVSRINNEYSEFFFSLYKDCEDKSLYDKAFLAYIKDVVWCDYIADYPQPSSHRDQIRIASRLILGMERNAYLEWICEAEFSEIQLKEFKDKNSVSYKPDLISSLKKAITMVDIWSKNTSSISFSIPGEKVYYNEKTLLRNLVDENRSNDDKIRRYAYFSYLSKYGYPNTNDEMLAYNAWKRIFYNIIENVPFKVRIEEYSYCLLFIKTFLDHLPDQINENVIYSKLIEVCEEKYPDSVAVGAMRRQMNEEKIKAKLILLDANWKTKICSIENYFTDGQIGFLLMYSQNDRCAGGYDLSVFGDFCEKIKWIFDSDKKVKSDISISLLNRALLTIDDTTSDETAFLEKQSNSTTTWGFYGDDFKGLFDNFTDDKKRIFIKGILVLLKDKNTINEQLQAIIDATIASQKYISSWKELFLEYDVLDLSIPATFMINQSWDFKFCLERCIHLDSTKKNVLLIHGTTTRAYSIDMHLQALGIDLLKESKLCGKRILTKAFTTGDIDNPDNGFTYRYIRVEDAKINIGYSAHSETNGNIIESYYALNDSGVLKSGLSKTDVINEVLQLL